MCDHYGFDLDKKHRHYIKCEYNNCLLCLVKAKGAMKLAEIGKYLNLSPIRISQIEKKAIAKLGGRISKIITKNTLH